jgi:hypothetical protein
MSLSSTIITLDARQGYIYIYHKMCCNSVYSRQKYELVLFFKVSRLFLGSIQSSWGRKCSERDADTLNPIFKYKFNIFHPRNFLFTLDSNMFIPGRLQVSINKQPLSGNALSQRCTLNCTFRRVIEKGLRFQCFERGYINFHC